MMIHKRIRSEEYYLELFKPSGSPFSASLSSVPDEFKTYTVCFAAVTLDSCNIRYVPNIHRTYTLCLEAVTKKYVSIEHIPEPIRTYEFYKIMLERHPRMFRVEDEQYQTFGMVCFAMDHDSIMNYPYINWEILTIDEQEYIKLQYGK